MSIQEQLLDHKKLIKEWEKLFFAENGRIPDKADVKANKDIRKAYKTYNHLKEKIKRQADGNLDKRDDGKERGEKIYSKVADAPIITTHQLLNVSIDLTEDEDEGIDETIANAELGPTPQANGKVLSIFDMIMSPPDSSPLKQKKYSIDHFSSPTKATNSQQEFKTPTRAALRIQFTSLTPRGSHGKPSLMAKLREASSPQRSNNKEISGTPTKTTENVVETPFYLGKINNKFLFRDSAGASPVDITTPTKSSPAIEFQVSPSPLKPQRMISFGSTRSVSEIFNDNQSFNIEDFEDQKIEIEKELQLMEEELADDEAELITQSRKRKVLTQKRTTRRWKIKPNAPLDTEDAFEGKDIHEELKKLDETERKKHALYMEGAKDDKEIEEKDEEEEEEEEEEEQAPVLKKVAGPRSGKPKPISNNFQRLKINDPRSKRFKQRMRR